MPIKFSPLFFVCVFCTNLYSQVNFAPKIINAVGSIKYVDSSILKSRRIVDTHIGTGSLFFKTVNDSTGKVFLVTCLHVLPLSNQSKTIFFDIQKSVDDSLSFSTLVISLFDKNDKFNNNVRIDNDADLAVINVTDFFHLKELEYLKKHLLPYNLLATKEIIKKEKISVGDEIYFIGYPSFFYDKRNYSPIVRAGIISTPPNSDFYFNDFLKDGYQNLFKNKLPDKFNGFLIDASTFGGSSGSLVFLKPQYYMIGDTELQNRKSFSPYILGIVDLSFLDLNPSMPQKINLGAVISSEYIKKTIDLFPIK